MCSVGYRMWTFWNFKENFKWRHLGYNIACVRQMLNILALGGENIYNETAVVPVLLAHPVWGTHTISKKFISRKSASTMHFHMNVLSVLGC